MKIARTAMALAVLALAACASVPSYQRGYLAREDMELDASPGTMKTLERTFSAKEGASGGASVGGGGCGCN